MGKGTKFKGGGGFALNKPKQRDVSKPGEDDGKPAKPLTRESDDSKTKMADRLRKIRLQRANDKGRNEFSKYVAPEPETPKLTGVASWKLRGAARPWVEVEAAKIKDHHEVGIDAFALYGERLGAEIPAAAVWLESLVEAADEKFEAGDLEGGAALCAEALASDGQDLAGASVLVAKQTWENGDGHVATCSETSGGLPKWARLVFLTSSPAHKFVHQDDDAPLRAALSANPFAAWCLAYPEAFDAAVECCDDLADHRLAPKGVLEALLVHHHIGEFFFENREPERAAFSAALRRNAAAHLAESPAAPFPEEVHPDAAMFHKMFETGLEMIQTPSEPASK
ncbi:hypothetical protein M885DRAFT_546068 [Pelagophyceae sp. CCMP2097]|nr:hypothetical protein M885DRAFT_546068 [Pelagophyceae sp. CCMP2097]